MIDDLCALYPIDRFFFVQEMHDTEILQPQLMLAESLSTRTTLLQPRYLMQCIIAVKT
jgi:hypothetical protein